MAGLYIHIPFCHSKCVYCDFYSVARRSAPDEVIDGITREYETRRGEIGEDFTTIYIGGGTPSILSASQLERLTAPLDLSKAVEFTIEANPEDINPDKVNAWLAAGINRVSLGVQTLDDAVLRRLGRRHTSAQAIDAINLLAAKGIHNISADLIYGLPGISSEGWENDLRCIIDTGITHLSAYCLTCYDGTMLHRMQLAGRFTPLSDEETEERFNSLRRITSAAGFEHYEISNFARPGYRSRHNSTYWHPRGTWVGLGPSAHSFDGKVRRADCAPVDQWLSRLPHPYDIEPETELDLINDMIVSSLRTTEGLDLQYIPNDYAECLMRNAAPLIEAGHMTFCHNRLAIPSAEWLVSDRYIREVMLDS